MTALIELITAWEEYSYKADSALSVEIFCRSYLKSKSSIANNTKDSTQDNEALKQELARSLGRVAAVHRIRLKLAFRDIGGIEPEWYYMMSAILVSGEVRKSDVISINLLLEPTTSIDIINRMVKAGLLEEKVDPSDKRVRLIRLSKAGTVLHAQLQNVVDKLNDEIYNGISYEMLGEITYCLKLIAASQTKALLEKKKT